MSMKLPSEDLNLLDTRDLLDGLLEVKPSLRHYLCECERIMLDCPLPQVLTSSLPWNGVVKILGGRVKQLSWVEKATLKPFESEASAAAAATEETTKVGFAGRMLKRRKVQDKASAYMQLNVIPRRRMQLKAV
ncbi:LOW QUALITY PROTEIN: hypothetical protein PHMEG_00027104 [Phytophthora megakarya]|uniref:Uncharacterized protein n=1 Tax=Phytophthora megakarya TaxID=4795 RepID=A0A225VAL1_9STRA|nr:LOW QUALITY PROTEIN: hypothetical protein PHMEG_00027104 [Phytophthora megakarya]